MKNPFTVHPHSVGETYFQHFCFASKAGARLFITGLALITHSIFPFIFITTGRRTVFDLNQQLRAKLKLATVGEAEAKSR
jgi:hypothetical protein